MRWLGLASVALGAFVAMEGVSYATHRWIMHGPGMRWHRSHHVPSDKRLEKNDVFPVVFSLVGIALFATAAALDSSALFFAAVGVTAYGAAYVIAHDIYTHRRLGIRLPDRRYLSWVRDSHRVHHTLGGEPYGMLLPILSARSRAAAARRDERRESNRSTRSRL
ncbi:MAG: crtZ [Acidimicrobiales bacterium]|nr:crtZ [Acidimicrobiales bacterium]